LRLETMQAIAVVELLLERWYEPPNTSSLHLSTLIQQILSVIAQHGGASAPQLFSALCSDGPFVHVSRPMFLRLLRDLGGHDLIVQASDGTILPGGTGEKLLNHFSFYAAFETSPEYRLEAHGKPLGTMPIEFAIEIGSFLVFAGRRWKVLDIDRDARVIQLTRAKGGRPPKFSGGLAEVADGIRKKMRSLYADELIPAYLSSTTRALLSEGRSAFRRLNLHNSAVVPYGNNTILFPWRGDQIINTLAVVLGREGIELEDDRIALTCRNTDPDRLSAILTTLASSPEPDSVSLAVGVLNKERDKHDRFLGESLLTEAYAARNLAVPGAWSTLRDLTKAEISV